MGNDGHVECTEKKSMTFRVLKMLVLLQAFALAACSGVLDTGSQLAGNADASPYKADLLSAISKADRIIVIEHSDRFDGMDAYVEGKADPQPLPIVTYHKQEMSAAQRKIFATRIDAMPARAEEAAPACTFQHRHTFQFYSGATLISTMQICFQCGQLRWDGSSYNAPRNIYSELKKMVIEMGLTPERDWDQLRLSHKAPPTT